MPALIALVKDRHWHQLEPLQQIYRKYGYVLIIYDIYIYIHIRYSSLSQEDVLSLCQCFFAFHIHQAQYASPFYGQYGEAGELDRFRRQGGRQIHQVRGRKRFVSLTYGFLSLRGRPPQGCCREVTCGRNRL